MKIEAIQAASAPTLLVGRRNHHLLGFTATLLAARMTCFGVGFVLLSAALARAAFVSGPLVLAWVTGAGVSLSGTSCSGAKS